MKFSKKISVASIAAAVAFVAALLAIIFYGVTVATGYFAGTNLDAVVATTVWGMVLLCVYVASSFFKLEGLAGKVFDFVMDAIKVAIPFLFIAAIIALAQARAQGFAFILFSNEEILATIQTPENMMSIGLTVASIACYLVGVIATIVSAFFTTKKD